MHVVSWLLPADLLADFIQVRLHGLGQLQLGRLSLLHDLLRHREPNDLRRQPKLCLQRRHEDLRRCLRGIVHDARSLLCRQRLHVGSSEVNMHNELQPAFQHGLHLEPHVRQQFVRLLLNSLCLPVRIVHIMQYPWIRMLV